MTYFVNGNFARCKHCIYYEEQPVQKEKQNGPYVYPGEEPDGFCNRIFPRGYTNAGKPGGYVWSGKHACWLIELKKEYRPIGEDPSHPFAESVMMGRVEIEEVNELRLEILERNRKAKRITADYQREMESAWNRWEDSDGKMERRMASDK